MKSFKLFVEELQKTGSQQGSNPGGKYKDSDTGKEYYIKHPDNPDQAKVEKLTSDIHLLMGLHTLNPKVQNINGKSAVVSEYNNDIEPLKSHHLQDLSDENHKHLGTMYAAGVLTKNWDIAGTGVEHGQGNIFKDKKTGKLISGDTGGSFHFRAQGGHKDYTPDISEKDSLLDHSMSEGAKYFHHALSKPGVIEHIKNTLQNLNMDKVKKAFSDSGLHNHEELHKNFVERHKKLIDHFSSL